MKTDAGDIWHFDGDKEKWPVGLTAAAGQSVFQIGATGQRYETMRPGSFDTAARLSDMDADGIYAQVLYPSVTQVARCSRARPTRRSGRARRRPPSRSACTSAAS
jgi:hypothetical protein